MASKRKPPVPLDPDLVVPEREIPPIPADADDREVLSIRDRAIAEYREIERELTVLGAQVGTWRTELAQKVQREERALVDLRERQRRAVEEITIAEAALRARNDALVAIVRDEAEARSRLAGLQREIDRISAERIALGDTEAVIAGHRAATAALSAEYDDLAAGIATLTAERDRLTGEVALAEAARVAASHEAERLVAGAKKEAAALETDRATQRTLSAALTRQREEISGVAAQQAETARALARREAAVQQAERDAQATLDRVRQELDEAKKSQAEARTTADRAAKLLEEVATGREALAAREATLDERERTLAEQEQALGVRVAEQDQRAETMKTKALELEQRESTVRQRERALGKAKG